MIQRFCDRLIAAKVDLVTEFMAKAPDDYDALLRRLVVLLAEDESGDAPDPKRITIIDDGEYQGTRLYIIGAAGYQPRVYWSVFVAYGSCSGCDTFEANKSYADEVSEREADGYYTMMLHMVQGMAQLENQ